MDQYNSKGWLNRRKLANLNRFENADEERLAIRRDRQRLYDEQAANAEASKAAYDAENAMAQCACTACGGSGRLEVPKAMRVVKALHNFGFGDHTVSKAEIAALAAIAKGDPIPPGCAPISFSYGSVSPAPDHLVSAVETAPSEVVTPKPSKGKRSELSETRNVETVTHDGFLIED
jgi:hypothetical protein